MKTIFLALILTLAGGDFLQIEAQTSQQLKLRVTAQKAVSGSKLKIKFVSVVEDSRCPEGTNCIWAGNAKVKIQVGKTGGEMKTFELNSNSEPKSVSFEGYEIKLTGLEPHPKANVRINRNGYTATFTVAKAGNSK